MVLSPEHPIIDKLRDQITNFDACMAYRAEAAKKSDFERAELAKEKTGVQIEGVVPSPRQRQGNPHLAGATTSS